MAALLLAAPSVVIAARLNERAPAFSLKDSRGQTILLAGLRGRVVFVNFWASWCAPCLSELPELDRLARHYVGRKVTVLAVNVDRDPKAAKELLKKLQLSPARFQVLWDSQSRAVAAYDVPTMPSSVIVDQRGVLRHLHSGFRSDDPAAWRQEIDALLKS